MGSGFAQGVSPSPAPSHQGFAPPGPVERGPGLFPAPPGGGRAQRAQSRGGAFGPCPCFGFAGPPGRQNAAAPRAALPSSAAKAHCLPPLFAAASPSCGREKTMRPAPLRSGCPRRSQSAIIGSHCDLPSPTVARIWRSPARPPGAQYVSNPASEASALFPSGNTARPQVDPGFCNKQKPRGRKADLAATGVHMIQGALFRLL